jgi:integrase
VKPTGSKFVLDRKDIPADPNAYVYRDPRRGGGRWSLYFYDRETKERHRFVLKDGNGNYPPPTIEGQETAWMLGISKYVELKGKSDRGEAIRSLKFGEMVKKFLTKERRRISEIPHTGISKTRYRLLETQLRWICDYLGNENREVHKLRRGEFLNYEVWRKERAKEFNKEIPQQSTINQELSTLRRCFNEVAVANGYLTKNGVPEIPNVKLPKNKKHRRDDLTEKEWLELEKCARYYWTKGLTRILDDQYRIEKDNSGQFKTLRNVQHASTRGRKQITHRQIIYYAMRISMDTGIRIGSLKKMQWKHISENTSIPKEERKIWVLINVPPENTKTGRSYTISAPIAKYLEGLRRLTSFKSPNDFLFVNQGTGQIFSERIWKDSLCEMLVESRLADWSPDDSNNQRKVEIHSGKNLTWYSFRHTYITMRLNAGVPVPTVAANTDTSMKYIEEHYFHYRASEATGLLAKGRRFGSSLKELQWIDAVEGTP